MCAGAHTRQCDRLALVVGTSARARSLYKSLRRGSSWSYCMCDAVECRNSHPEMGARSGATHASLSPEGACGRRPAPHVPIPSLTLSVCMCVSECISIVRSKESNAEEKILAFAKQALFVRLKQTRKKERERLQKNTRQHVYRRRTCSRRWYGRGTR